jgi:uncharacterized protein with von Willebrand factor type A (vWA) domain
MVSYFRLIFCGSEKADSQASELITNREIVSARIRDDLLTRAKEFNILLEDVSITHMTFGKEFTTAVEQKQIAQQDAERAKFVVEKAEQERQAAVIRAEGEAEAANTISAAINKAGDAFVQFRKIEASREIGESLTVYEKGIIADGLQRLHFLKVGMFLMSPVQVGTCLFKYLHSNRYSSAYVNKTSPANTISFSPIKTMIRL